MSPSEPHHMSRTHNLQSKDQDQSVEKYSPLDQQTDEIRILMLQPGVGLDPLRCTLATCQLGNCKAFEALSYAWGHPTPVEPIFINGSRTLIAHNLSVALQHLRLPQAFRALWVDAVCINQTDIGERNHQVFIMNRLYSAAERVLVWLGEARDHSDIAMKWLEELAEGQKMTLVEEITSGPLIYNCLMDRDWWGRLWVVQEVVLAKSDPILICGPNSLPWSIFMKGFRAAGSKAAEAPEHIEKGLERWTQCNALYYLRQFHHSLSSSNGVRFCNLSLGLILQFTKDFHSTDPRDKIYGALGLLSMNERERMKPDYKKPIELVFLEATQHILEHGNYSPFFFSIFSFSPSGKGLSRASPSWVPDFSAQKALNPGNPEGLIHASLSKAPMSSITRECVSFQDDNRVLELTGVLFDTVEVAVELKDRNELLLTQIPELEHLIQLAAEKQIPTDDPLYCLNTFKKHEDIFQVLTAGRDNSDDPATSLRDQYEALTGRAAASSLGFHSATETSDPLVWLLKDVFPGRCFFVTKMGFFGVAVATVRENDDVTFLFGERLPIILRPRGLFYSMVGAAHVSGVMDDEVTGDMYERGLVEKRTFLIR
jgi:hypothetical protein